MITSIASTNYKQIDVHAQFRFIFRHCHISNVTILDSNPLTLKLRIIECSLALWIRMLQCANIIISLRIETNDVKVGKELTCRTSDDVGEVGRWMEKWKPNKPQWNPQQPDLRRPPVVRQSPSDERTVRRSCDSSAHILCPLGFGRCADRCSCETCLSVCQKRLQPLGMRQYG